MLTIDDIMEIMRDRENIFISRDKLKMIIAANNSVGKEINNRKYYEYEALVQAIIACRMMAGEIPVYNKSTGKYVVEHIFDGISLENVKYLARTYDMQDGYNFFSDLIKAEKELGDPPIVALISAFYEIYKYLYKYYKYKKEQKNVFIQEKFS